MLNPFRSEASAFRFALWGAAVALVALPIGVFASSLAGWGIFAAALGGTLAHLYERRQRPRRTELRDAASAPHAPGPPAHRVLVVANEALTGTLVRRELLKRVELWPELHIVAPVLASRGHFWANDTDREVREAKERLEATVAWAKAQGFAASGEVSDPGERPALAVEETLRRFGASEVIVVTHPPERESWQEAGLLDSLLEQLDLPVTHVVVDLERGRLVLEPPEEVWAAGGARS
jgi:hypothetical protein